MSLFKRGTLAMLAGLGLLLAGACSGPSGSQTGGGNSQYVTVKGSESGLHSGELSTLENRRGTVFTPETGFAAGELVSVRAELTPGTAAAAARAATGTEIAFEFTVATPPIDSGATVSLLSDQSGQNLTEQIEFTGPSGVYGLAVWSNVRTGVLQKFRLEVKAPSAKTYLPVLMKNYVPPRGPFGNGGFENDSRWLLSGELEHIRTTEKQRSGSYSLQLGHNGPDRCYGEVPCSGSGDDCESAATAIQGFDVPNSGSPSLSFYYQISTYDHKPSGDRKADEFSVLIRDLGTGEENLVYLDDLSWVTTYKCYNLSEKATWQSVSSIDLSSYKGKTVELIFKVTNGGHNFWNTWVYIDDVTCSGC